VIHQGAARDAAARVLRERTLLCVVQPKLGLVPGTQSGSVNNDRITCRFQRLRNVAATGRQRRRSAREANSDVVFSLDAAKYYILMAKGEASRGQL